MRLLLPALLLLAAPAVAQTTDEAEEIEILTEEREVSIDGDAPGEVRIRIRRSGADGDSLRVVELGGAGMLERIREAMEGADLDGVFERVGPMVRRIEIGAGDGLPSMIDAVMGATPETRSRIQRLTREARSLARDAAEATGAERDRLEAELDGVLGDLFDARGDARRERADRLRERADALREQADELDASAAARERDRRRLIDERKRELLGEPGADW